MHALVVWLICLLHCMLIGMIADGLFFCPLPQSSAGIFVRSVHALFHSVAISGTTQRGVSVNDYFIAYIHGTLNHCDCSSLNREHEEAQQQETRYLIQVSPPPGYSASPPAAHSNPHMSCRGCQRARTQAHRHHNEH